MNTRRQREVAALAAMLFGMLIGLAGGCGIALSYRTLQAFCSMVAP